MIPTADEATHSLASRANTVAELVENLTELGEIDGVHISNEQVTVQPGAENALARVRTVANWAQHWHVPVSIHVVVNTSTHVTCRVRHGAVPITVFVALGVRDAWQLARLLQIDLDDNQATVDPGTLIAALAGDET